MPIDMLAVTLCVSTVSQMPMARSSVGSKRYLAPSTSKKRLVANSMSSGVRGLKTMTLTKRRPMSASKVLIGMTVLLRSGPP